MLIFYHHANYGVDEVIDLTSHLKGTDLAVKTDMSRGRHCVWANC